MALGDKTVKIYTARNETGLFDLMEPTAMPKECVLLKRHAECWGFHMGPTLNLRIAIVGICYRNESKY